MTGHLHPYVLKGGDKRWAVVIFLGKQPDKSGVLKPKYRWIRGFQTKKEASVEMRRILGTVDDGSYVKPTKESLAEFLARWLTTYAKPNVSRKTYERYSQIVENDIVPKLGQIKISNLSAEHLDAFYAWAQTSGRKRDGTGLSAQTVLHFHRVLHKALKQAVKSKLRATNPADAATAPRPVSKEMTAVDTDRSAWLIQAASGTEFFIPVMYALCTGLRRGEILAQRWQDVDFEMSHVSIAQALEETEEGGVLFKIPKGKKRRKITIPALLVEALRAHRTMQEANRKLFGSDYRVDLDLIIAMPDGSVWPPDSFSASYYKFTKKIGMVGIRFHDLRHSHASQLLRQGESVKTVQERLGHATAKVTLDTYAHTFAGDDERAVNKLDVSLRQAIEKLRMDSIN